MTGEHERLPRLLSLVPYLRTHRAWRSQRRQLISGVSEGSCVATCNRCRCGAAGLGPGGLIDRSVEGDAVSVIFDAGISRPLRLTAEEALALVVALRTLMETPGLTDRAAVERALAKVEAAAGGSVDAADTVAVAFDQVDRLQLVVEQAVEGKRALALRYYTATRDETTDRTVDPMRVFTMDGRFYRGLVPAGEGMRCFGWTARTPGSRRTRPAHGRGCGPVRGRVHARSEHLLVVLQVAPAYGWVADCTGDRGHRDRGRPAPDQRAGRGPRLGASTRPRLGGAGRAVVAGVVGRVGGQRSGRSNRRVRGVLTGPIQAAAVKSAECGGSWRSRGALR